MQLTDFSKLVIVADNVPIIKDSLTQFSREVDRAYKKNVEYLKVGFETFIEKVEVYDDPRLFMQKVSDHKNDIIFPYWHGEHSRNKHALIASVCEIENLIYIGPDTYSNIVCSDKIISKDICRMAGIKYPQCKVITDPSEAFIWPFHFPAVVKPVYEGSSLGITQRNIVNSDKEIMRLANELFTEFQQPIMIEEFIAGTEVNLAFVGWKDHIKAWSAAKRVHTKVPDFFEHYLFAFEEKNLSDDIILEDARDLISDALLKKLVKVFSWLDKIEYIRIDGKIFNSEFYCIELTQDADLHPEGSFFSQLSYVGYDFNHALKLIVENCLERYNNLSPTQA